MNEKKAQTIVNAEIETLTDMMTSYSEGTPQMMRAAKFLDETRPVLIEVGEKVGYDNPVYVNLSTQVVECAVSTIAYVLADASVNPNDYQFYAFSEAQKLFSVMDSFDMYTPYRKDRYDVYRNMIDDINLKMHNTGGEQPSKFSRLWSVIRDVLLVIFIIVMVFLIQANKTNAV